MNFTGSSLPLSDTGLKTCTDLLGVGAAELWTILAVETKSCGFLSDRRPLILFERHIFHRQTKGKFDATNPSVSASTPGGYLGGTKEYDRLEQAVALDRQAALNSASWGIGQVMGFNAASAGFASAETMVAAMQDSEDAQLTAVAGFLKANRLHIALAKHDWAAFASGYNGADFAKNQYDTRLAGAFAAFSAGSLPNIKVRQAQVLLMFLGIDTGVIDGISGKRTRSAIANFQALQGLPVSDVIDDVLIAALLKAVQGRSNGSAA